MARSYQIRLSEKDLLNKEFLKKIADITSKSEEYLLDRFMPIAKLWGSLE